MAFIEKKDPVVINIKLTSKGRELLAQGKLIPKYFAIGDSEIDYEFNAVTGNLPFDSNILRPVDKNPSLLSFVTKTLSGDPYNVITSIPASHYDVVNSVEPIGFFNIGTGSTTFITDSNHVKQPDAMIDVSTLTGGTSPKRLTLLKAPTYGTSAEEPAIGDLLLVKWTYVVSTTGHTINKNLPTPYLMYKIDNIISGSLATNNMVIEVDRNLPNFSGFSTSGVYAGALIYYNYINFTGSTIFTDFSTDYLDESVLSFLQNSQCPTIVFPFWNMSIIFTEEIAGVQIDKLKYSQFNTKAYGGFVSYIQNQAPVYKKLGVIHYTNQSPANVYAEGFYLNTPVLDVPTIMWHKSTGGTLGARFTAYGSPKLLTGVTHSLDTTYYDLADELGNVVGKVFTDLKIFVIEDQELLFAMSYKSNRSWTLPDYLASFNDIVVCPDPEPCPDCPDCPECPSGDTITTIWTTPVNNKPVSLAILAKYYCHSTSGGWQSFATPTVTLTNVTNAGYKVCVQAIPAPPGTGGGVSLYACDYINHTSIAPPSGSLPGTGGGPGSQFAACLIQVNHASSYCFGGTLA